MKNKIPSDSEYKNSKKDNVTKSKELGFGSNVKAKSARFVNKDGTFNVKRIGLSTLQNLHIYHALIGMSWTRFAVVTLSFYTLINLLFAFLYVAVGVEHLVGVIGTDFVEKFWEAFFFSAQTLTTVGYGRISPVGFTSSMIAAIESMFGLMGFAIITGILYGRFSRPTAKIIFSEYAIIAPYKGINAFEFRIVNQRKNQLIEVEVQVLLSMNKLIDGQKKGVFLDLTLEAKRVNFFPLPWTIVHPIDENSPIFGYTAQDLIDADAEIIIMVKAYDDTFSQNIYKRYSYTASEIIWGAKFNVIYKNGNDGYFNLMLNQFQELEKVALNSELA
ncbi:MAG TPA: ion channel [Bacteroidia bacterium]|nr:ion channel [Bacteroidia bacterium]